MSRPTKLDNLKVKKLEEAFALGSTIAEACYYADISKQTYYNWTEQKPELLDRFEQLQQAPILKARRTLVNALESDPRLAFKYLERKLKDEFGPRYEVKEEVDKEAFSRALLEVFDDPDNLPVQQELQ